MKKLALFALLLSSRLSAQSLILGIPSAEVAPVGILEITHETQLKAWQQPVYWNSFNFVNLGVNPYLEVTAAIINFNDKLFRETVISTGAKLARLLQEETPWEPRMYMGGNVLYANKQARPWGYWFYSGASIRLPISKTRLTLGGSYGSEEIFGFRRFNRSDGSQLKEPIRPLSLMLGLEQPITKNLTFIIDYFGGEHELGATMPGVQYKRGHNLFIVGYKIPNYERLASDALILEVMIGAQLWKQKNSFEGDAGQ